MAQKNSHDWAISARGFNTDLGNKLLVMIDGRTVYTPLYSGVFWDVQDYLLEDIDRIEVISGPGGALWGANAVNGVINIITKSAKDTQGVYADAGGGSQPQDFAGARYGGHAGPGHRNIASMANTSIAATRCWPTATPHRMPGGRAGRVPRRFGCLSARQADACRAISTTGSENEQTGGTSDASGANVLGRWSRTLSEDSDLSLQSYLDQTHLSDPVPPLDPRRTAVRVPPESSTTI